MPSGGRRRRGRGLGFAGRTEDRMSGRRTGCGGSGEPDPAEKRSSSSSSKAVEVDCSPEAAGRTKEPRKRSELRELLWRARSMVELSVCRRVCQCDCEGGGDVTSLVRGGETATSAQVISENLMGGVPMQTWGPRVCGGASHLEKMRDEAKRSCQGVEIRAPFRRIRFWTDHSWAQSSSGSGRAGTHQARVIPQQTNPLQQKYPRKIQSRKKKSFPFSCESRPLLPVASPCRTREERRLRREARHDLAGNHYTRSSASSLLPRF